MKKSSNNINARLAIDNAINVDGIQTFNQSFTAIGVLFDSAFHITITHAVDQIGDAFPPNHTQNTRAHHNKFTPSIPFDCNNQITGIIATVIGILSIKADKIAVHQRITNAVNKIFSFA
jgi:hypothetical protein